MKQNNLQYTKTLIPIVIACMLLVCTPASLADEITSSAAVIEAWYAAYAGTDNLGNKAEMDLIAQNDAVIAKDDALAAALDYMIACYGLSYEELVSHTPFISLNKSANAWQFDIVPPDASMAYALYVDANTGEIQYAYYGEGEG